MNVLYLTEADVGRLLDMPTAVSVVEEAFRRWSAGEAHNVPRSRTTAPGIVLHTMSASAAYLGVVGWKTYTTTKSGAQFLVGIYAQEDGRLLALIEANRLGQMRTGATTAVAASSMALLDAAEVGLFGAGFQAETQLAALACVRPLREVFVYARNESKRADFCRRVSKQLGINVQPVDRPSEAAEDLPIVVTATNASTPVFDGSWLAEGAFVAAIGSNWQQRAEIDAHTVERASNIVCDSVEACRGEAGDFVDAMERGIFDWTRAVNLSEVVAGRAVGRSRPGSITLFKSVGLALEDVALGAKLCQLAAGAGVGRTLAMT